MGRKKSKYPQIEGLEITAIAAEGKALGRVGDKVVFVAGAVVGDVVNVQINSSRRSYMEGYITSIVQESPLRVKPFCDYFGECGGCKWQMLPYEKQLEFKEQQVADQLTRLSDGTPMPSVNPIVGSENTTYYRNKLEFTFSSRRWVRKQEVAEGAELKSRGGVGFHIPKMFDKVIDVHKCYLQSELSNDILNAVRDFTYGVEGYDYYDLRTHEGLMRNLIVRTSSTGEVMVIVVFAKEQESERLALLEFLKEKFPQITSLCYIINQKLNDSIADQEALCYNGTPYIMEEMEGLRFRINPKSFYQTNSAQAYELYSHTRRMAAIQPEEVVYDLYTGAGTIANFVARGAKRVVGVEYVEEAIVDARVNSELNGIGNTTFFAGDMKDVLTPEFITQNGVPDVMIVDPPRAGMHPSVVEVILGAEPSRIVYVSCNPATQARDIGLLAAKYEVTEIQPVDMFPHTAHVENIALLIRKQQQ